MKQRESFAEDLRKIYNDKIDWLSQEMNRAEMEFNQKFDLQEYRLSGIELSPYDLVKLGTAREDVFVQNPNTPADLLRLVKLLMECPSGAAPEAIMLW